LLTVTAKLHVEVLLTASLTEQLTVVTPTGKANPEAGTQTGVCTPGQLSVTTGGAYVTTCVVPVVAAKMFAGHVIAGACVSLTVTVNAHAAGLFAASVTVQLTVVVPFWKVEPDGGTQIGAPTPGQLSPTVGAAKVTTAVHNPAAAGTTIFAGHVITGACVSLTVTVKLVNPPPLALVQPTVVTPFGNTEPEAGTHVTAPQVPLVVGAV
jgi:hypothetical protein